MKKFSITILAALWVSLSYAQIKVDSEGKIGLGTTTPSTDIDISGSVDITGPFIDIMSYYNLELWADNLSQSKLTFQPTADDYYLDILPSYAPVYFGSYGRRFMEMYAYTLNCYSLVQQSDINTKENIKSLEKSLDKLTSLNAITFDYKKEYYNSDSSSAKYDSKLKDKIDKERKSHFGFSAQEVQQLFPELVHEQEKGLLGVNYVEFIPVIISGLKEQQTQINTLQQIVTAQEKEIVALKKDVANLAGDKTLKKATTEPTGDESEIMLYQNAPNPFNHETEIRYYIPETIAKASIYVHDLNGGEIMVLPIENTGDGSVIIKGAELMKGMYTYTLVADDQIIDSKRMILTE